MVNGLHLYSVFIQSASQFMPHIHPFTHTFIHQLAGATNAGRHPAQREQLELGVLLKDTTTVFFSPRRAGLEPPTFGLRDEDSTT